MDHLYSSTVRVEVNRMHRDSQGRVALGWVQETDPDPEMQALLERMPCRLDLNFIRPGKDVVPAMEAGQAPDRYGIMFAEPYMPLKAGHRVVTVPNDDGREPIKGIFEIRYIPDRAQDYDDVHHIEVQVFETPQNLKDQITGPQGE